MNAIALIIDMQPVRLHVITRGEEATQVKWLFCQKQVDDILASGRIAKCLLFRNNPLAATLYGLGDVSKLEINANETYPSG